METTFRGIGFTPSVEDNEFLEKKLKKLSFADDYIVTLDIVAKKESKGIGFHLDATMHFSWKKEKIVSEDSYELYEGIEKIADKIQRSARKEKEKVMGL